MQDGLNDVIEAEHSERVEDEDEDEDEAKVEEGLWEELEAAGREEGGEAHQTGVEDEDSLRPEEAAEEGEEGRQIVTRKSPTTVTKAMKAEHDKTHTPYRSWCKWCV